MAFCLPLTLAGCVSSPRFDYRGEWKGSRNLTLSPETPSDVAVSLRRVILRFDGKGRFSLLESGMPKAGSFVPTSYGAALEVDEVNGRPIGMQPDAVRQEIPVYEVRPQADGTLQLTDPRPPSESISLTRSSKP